MKIKYKDWLSTPRRIVEITTFEGKTWQFERCGISEDAIKELIKENDDAVRVVRRLISEGKLKPIYGGKIILDKSEL